MSLSTKSRLGRSFGPPVVWMNVLWILLNGLLSTYPTDAQIVSRSSDALRIASGYALQFAVSTTEKPPDISPIPSVFNQPKNAILLDSYLLITRSSARPETTEATQLEGEKMIFAQTEPSTSSSPVTEPSERNDLHVKTNIATTEGTTENTTVFDTEPTQTLISSTTSTTPDSEETLSTEEQTIKFTRQPKIQQTGRPNEFYLGDSDNDGWWSSVDVQGSSSMNPLPIIPTTTDSSQAFSGFYGNLPRTTGGPAAVPSNRDDIPPPFRSSGPARNPSQIATRVSITDSSPYGPPKPEGPVNRRPPEGAAPFAPPSASQPVDVRKTDPSNAERRPGLVAAAPNPVSDPLATKPSGNGRPRNKFSNPIGGVNAAVSSLGRPSIPEPSASDDVQLETCSVGIDSTCNSADNEVCRREDGATTCTCRMGTARASVRDPCQASQSFFAFVRVNRLQDRPLSYGRHFADPTSYPYSVLSREVNLGIDSIFHSSDLREHFVRSKVNGFNAFADDVMANVTVTFINFPESASQKRIQSALIDSLAKSERRLGTSNAYVSNLLTAVPNVIDINECLSPDFNDCNATAAVCTNTIGAFTCSCKTGYVDPFVSNPLKSGRYCETCEDSFCNGRGVCLMGPKGKMCQCNGWYIGASCETDGQVVAVACGSSAIAFILIAVTLVFLLRWSRNGGSQRGGSMSTLHHGSEISAGTFTYVPRKSHGQSPEDSLNLSDKIRMAYVVHPSLLNELPAHQRNQLLDTHFYEVRPPPGRLAPGHALLAAEISNRQRSSRDRLASDLESAVSENPKKVS